MADQHQTLVQLRSIFADRELSQAITERLSDAALELWPDTPMGLLTHEQAEAVFDRAIENCPP